jgi:hypothetical protein
MVPILLAWLNLHGSLSGVIDAIEDENALLEVESTSGDLQNFIVPIDIFPCMIREGDVIYFEHSDEGTIIKCKN